jgi:hypothetical protein
VLNIFSVSGTKNPKAMTMTTEAAAATTTMTTLMDTNELFRSSIKVGGKQMLQLQPFSTSVGRCMKDVEWKIVTTALNEGKFLQPMVLPENQLRNECYTRMILAEAWGCWQAAFSKIAADQLKHQLLLAHQFASVLLAYQKQFEKEHPDKESWRLDMNHLILLHYIMTRTSKPRASSAMTFVEFLLVFLWLGPSTLAICEDIPPCDAIVRYVYAGSFERRLTSAVMTTTTMTPTNSEDVSTWIPNQHYIGAISKLEAETIMTFRSWRFLVRLCEGRVLNNGRSLLEFNHRQLVMSLPDADWQLNSPSYSHHVMSIFLPDYNTIVEREILNDGTATGRHVHRNAKHTKPSQKRLELERRQKAHLVNDAIILNSLLVVPLMDQGGDICMALFKNRSLVALIVSYLARK